MCTTGIGCSSSISCSILIGPCWCAGTSCSSPIWVQIKDVVPWVGSTVSYMQSRDQMWWLHVQLLPQRTHRVAMVDFWCTFHHNGKISHPLSLYLPSRTKLQCMLQLRGQILFPYFISTPIYTLWLLPCTGQGSAVLGKHLGPAISCCSMARISCCHVQGRDQLF